MKNILLIIIMTATAVLQAQMEYEKYTMPESTKNFSIQVTEEGVLYVDIMSLDATSKTAGIILRPERVGDFIACLDTAKKKYEEWKAIAIQNDVKKLRKVIDCGCSLEGYFSYGKWQFDYSVYPEFAFVIVEKKGVPSYNIVFNTGELNSSSNQFMDSDGGIIIFNSTKSIDSFVRKISPRSVETFLTKPKEGDLFK